MSLRLRLAREHNKLIIISETRKAVYVVLVYDLCGWHQGEEVISVGVFNGCY